MKRHTPIASNLKLFSGISILFFVWGVVTILNDLLVPIFKEQFHLNYFSALLVQFMFFLAYFMMALPMVKLLNRWQYKKSIIFGLMIIVLGCVIFLLAKQSSTYQIFLYGLFILACGVVMLQVSANTLITLLGAHQSASARLSLAQGINSFGYVLTPLLVSTFISVVFLPYIYGAMIIFLLLVIGLIACTPFAPYDHLTLSTPPKNHNLMKSIFSEKYFILSIVAIFLYVGTEVSAGSFLISFLGLSNIAHMGIHQAGKYLSFFWGGAMIGRLIGSYILRLFKQHQVLMAYALINAILAMSVSITHGYIAMWSLLTMGLFNSIMFPSIFTLGVSLFKSNEIKNCGAGCLVMANVGGACIPLLQGHLADVFGLQKSFLLLVGSYIFIAIFAGLFAKKEQEQEQEQH